MHSHDEGREKSGRSRRVVASALVIPGVLLLSGCSVEDAKVGFLGIPSRDMTDHTAEIIDLWNGSWVGALGVGFLVWGLMIWAMIVYRRRRGETGLPHQLRYNIPLEILYIVVPIMMVVGLFVETATAQSRITDTSAKADVHINVVGAQWKWDFNYLDANVYEVGVQGQLDGKPGAEAQLPTLYLPVNKRVEFTVTSRDVMHSFWMPFTLFKLDAIPGVENKFQMVPKVTGTYKGKCSELCGEYHSEMLFNVAVVSQEEYDRRMAELKAKGQTGRLETNLGRSDTPPGGAVPGNSAAVTQGTENK